MRKFIFLLMLGGMFMSTSFAVEPDAPDDSQNVEYQMGSPDMIPTPNIAVEVEVPDIGQGTVINYMSCDSETFVEPLIDALALFKYDTDNMNSDANPFVKVMVIPLQKNSIS